MTWKLVGAAAMALAVAACGTEPGERTTGGAAAGAATGAGFGAFGGPVGALAGAAIGAGAGAVTGAATSPSDLNLGEPPWENPRTRVPGVQEGPTGRRYGSYSGQSRSSGYSSSTVREAQRALQQQGFNPGPVDGIYGRQTASAVQDFQRSHNMQATGRLDRQVLQALNLDQSGNAMSRTGSDTRTGSTMGGGAGSDMSSPGYTGMGTTGSTGPGGTSDIGSGNQPATGGTSQQSR